MDPLVAESPCPLAAQALVDHLAATALLDVDAALIAESAAYSTLQAGPEFARWLATHAGRPIKDINEGRVRVVRADGVLRITLSRPDRRNAVDAAMQQALVDALTVATVDPESTVVIDAEGSCFSSGGDLDEFGTAGDPAAAHQLRITRSPARLLAQVADRTTVHVHGACYGAGVELPAFAARVIADPDTTFTLPEVGMGLIPGAGGTVSLPRRIGRDRTAWLAVTGTTINATTALDWGLVDELARV